jgi:hypothetical protein
MCATANCTASRLRTHFSDARCMCAASKRIQKNIEIISIALRHPWRRGCQHILTGIRRAGSENRGRGAWNIGRDPAQSVGFRTGLVVLSSRKIELAVDLQVTPYGPKCANRSAGSRSEPIARSPHEQDKGNGQAHHDEHPILNFESQKVEMLDEKLHHSGPPIFEQDRGSGDKNILFLY